MNNLQASELILNEDGSIFHLHLLPHQIGDIVILVGDQSRVEMISKYFDSVEYKIQNREFVTHTGTLNGKKISALSTGIGTDNIDIVLNEIDALVNIDFNKRTINEKHKSLELVRLGTSGALQADIDVDSFVLSEYGLGMDGLLNFYVQNEKFNQELKSEFIRQIDWPSHFNHPYIVKASDNLLNKLSPNTKKGITGTACGFYGPQGRVLRLPTQIEDLNERLTNFNYQGLRITNFEMETSALYGLSALLGHHAATVCTIIANRIKKEFSSNYKLAVEKMVVQVLEQLTK
jgi:uridine phosphorylase